MVRLKWLIDVLRCIFDACVVKNPRNGANGYLWQNGGITPIIIPPLKLLLMRSSITSHPPHHLPYLSGTSPNEAVDRSLQKRERMIQLVKLHMIRAQDRMRNQADKHRTDRRFTQGDWVWLKLQPYKQTSLHQRTNQKLAHKFYGPFQVTSVIGKVAYKLNLLLEVKIHNVFHVSQLKPFHGRLPQATHIPPWFQGTAPVSDPNRMPETILDRRFVKVHNNGQTQYLVKWVHEPAEDSTWMAAGDFARNFPDFKTET